MTSAVGQLARFVNRTQRWRLAGSTAQPPKDPTSLSLPLFSSSISPFSLSLSRLFSSLLLFSPSLSVSPAPASLRPHKTAAPVPCNAPEHASNGLLSEGLVNLYRGLTMPLLARSIQMALMFGVYDNAHSVLVDTRFLGGTSPFVLSVCTRTGMKHTRALCVSPVSPCRGACTAPPTVCCGTPVCVSTRRRGVMTLPAPLTVLCSHQLVCG